MSKSPIDKEILQKLQARFCEANDIYITCVNRQREEITPFCMDDAATEFWKSHLFKDKVEHLLDVTDMTQVEEIVEEELEYPYLKLCSVITRVGHETILIWLVAAVIDDYVGVDDVIPEGIRRTTETRFYHALSFIETVAKYICLVQEQKAVAEEAMLLAKESEEKYKAEMYRSEAMTAVVNKLGSEDPFHKVADEILRITCQTLQNQGAALVRRHAIEPTVEVVCEYTTERYWNISNRLQGVSIDEVPFLDGKAYMLSSNSMMPERMERFFKNYHLQAGSFQPIELNGTTQMYLCLYEFEQERIWSVDDLKFISDIKRVLQSVLSKRVTKNSLISSYASLEAILEHAGCGIYVVDYDNHNVLYMNQNFREMFSSATKEINLEEILFERTSNYGEFGPKEEYIDYCDKWIDIKQNYITWVDGKKVNLGTVYDITEKKRYQQKIENQISHDDLTGVYNRMQCEQDLITYIREAEFSGAEGAFLRIDMDDFKDINEGLGHQYGDVLLKAIAHNLQQIHGVGKNCYRVGGDEFAVIVYGKSYSELPRICRDVRAIFEKPWFLKGADYYCTMSMGVVCFPTDSGSVDDLIKKSDIVLRSAKKKGKNAVEYYNDKIEDTSIRRLDLEKHMRRATQNSCSEFEIYYQPIIDMEKPGKECCGAEALVRWNSKELGFIAPGDFIPLAEYLGLVNQIGEHVLYEAAKRCKYWNDCGHPDYKVNVNLSVIQLLQNDFVDIVKKVLERTNINPSNLTLEVTESLAIHDMARMNKLLRQIKEFGVRVALDDFGTGYSSLNHIREMPIDVIKIDKCFVEHLSEDEFSGAFVKMVVELARTIGVTVCAEGVEDHKQLAALQEMKVRLIQGFYYGKPMQVQEFERLYL